MKERGIIFSGEMVRAILDGRKTQTRRVINRINNFGEISDFQRTDTPGYDWIFRNKCMLWNDVKTSTLIKMCPHGKSGDRLWLRETFKHYGNSKTGHNPVVANVIYKADGLRLDCGQWHTFNDAPQQTWWNTGKSPWTPSIHMPRWASRITLEITDVRVERVQDITDEDALAEGVDPDGYIPRVQFHKLWNSINEKRGYGWDVNSWVWVIEFKVIK
jgi:hypothetical protein